MGRRKIDSLEEAVENFESKGFRKSVSWTYVTDFSKTVHRGRDPIPTAVHIPCKFYHQSGSYEFVWRNMRSHNFYEVIVDMVEKERIKTLERARRKLRLPKDVKLEASLSIDPGEPTITVVGKNFEETYKRFRLALRRLGYDIEKGREIESRKK